MCKWTYTYRCCVCVLFIQFAMPHLPSHLLTEPHLFVYCIVFFPPPSLINVASERVVCFYIAAACSLANYSTVQGDKWGVMQVRGFEVKKDLQVSFSHFSENICSSKYHTESKSWTKVPLHCSLWDIITCTGAVLWWFSHHFSSEYLL